jgi:hypothetical protein
LKLESSWACTTVKDFDSDQDNYLMDKLILLVVVLVVLVVVAHLVAVTTMWLISR